MKKRVIYSLLCASTLFSTPHPRELKNFEPFMLRPVSLSIDQTNDSNKPISLEIKDNTTENERRLDLIIPGITSLDYLKNIRLRGYYGEKPDVLSYQKYPSRLEASKDYPHDWTSSFVQYLFPSMGGTEFARATRPDDLLAITDPEKRNKVYRLIGTIFRHLQEFNPAQDSYEILAVKILGDFDLELLRGELVQAGFSYLRRGNRLKTFFMGLSANPTPEEKDSAQTLGAHILTKAAGKDEKDTAAKPLYFVQRTVKALEEIQTNNALYYPPNLVQEALMGYAWMCAEKVEDLRLLFEAMHIKLPERWGELEYTEEEYKAIKKAFEAGDLQEKINKTIEENYEIIKENIKKREENDRIIKENYKIIEENYKIIEENKRINEENYKINEENYKIIEENSKKIKESSKKIKENSKKREENERINEENSKKIEENERIIEETYKIIKGIFDNAFKACFVGRTYQEYDSFYPPIISYSKAVYGESFSDCGETSLRNFFNLMFYNPVTQAFDTTILEDLSQKNSIAISMPSDDEDVEITPDMHPLERLIVFYKKHPSTQGLSNFSTHDHWAQVVSDLNRFRIKNRSLLYQKKNCEISSEIGIDNMINVISTLIPDARLHKATHKLTPKTRAHFFDLLLSILKPNGGFTWAVKGKDKEKGEQKIGDKFVKLLIKADDQTSFTWKFGDGHFSFDRESDERQSEEKESWLRKLNSCEVFKSYGPATHLSLEKLYNKEWAVYPYSNSDPSYSLAQNKAFELWQKGDLGDTHTLIHKISFSVDLLLQYPILFDKWLSVLPLEDAYTYENFVGQLLNTGFVDQDEERVKKKKDLLRQFLKKDFDFPQGIGEEKRKELIQHYMDFLEGSSKVLTERFKFLKRARFLMKKHPLLFKTWIQEIEQLVNKIPALDKVCAAQIMDPFYLAEENNARETLSDEMSQKKDLFIEDLQLLLDRFEYEPLDEEDEESSDNESSDEESADEEFSDEESPETRHLNNQKEFLEDEYSLLKDIARNYALFDSERLRGIRNDVFAEKKRRQDRLTVAQHLYCSTLFGGSEESCGFYKKLLKKYIREEEGFIKGPIRRVCLTLLCIKHEPIQEHDYYNALQNLSDAVWFYLSKEEREEIRSGRVSKNIKKTLWPYFF